MLQVEGGYAILFHKAGVSQFRYLDRLMAYQRLGLEPGEPGRIWALIDANENLAEPAPIFRSNTPFFVVEAASSRPKRFEWVRKMEFVFFYMKTWTFSEVLQAYVTPPLAAQDAHVYVVSQNPQVVALGQKVNSGTCMTSTGHPPWRCPSMLATRTGTNE